MFNYRFFGRVVHTVRLIGKAVLLEEAPVGHESRLERKSVRCVKHFEKVSDGEHAGLLRAQLGEATTRVGRAPTEHALVSPQREQPLEAVEVDGLTPIGIYIFLFFEKRNIGYKVCQVC